MGIWYMTRFYLPMSDDVSDEIYDRTIDFYKDDNRSHAVLYTIYNRFVTLVYIFLIDTQSFL